MDCTKLGTAFFEVYALPDYTFMDVCNLDFNEAVRLKIRIALNLFVKISHVVFEQSLWPFYGLDGKV